MTGTVEKLRTCTNSNAKLFGTYLVEFSKMEKAEVPGDMRGWINELEANVFKFHIKHKILFRSSTDIGTLSGACKHNEQAQSITKH